MKYFLSFIATIVLISSVTVESFVESDFGTFRNHYYLAVKQSKTWNDAKVYAESLGGYLVTIADKEENDFVFTFAVTKGLTNAIWIGLTDEVKEGQFVWVTGESFTYKNWNTGEPNNSGDEDHVQMYLPPSNNPSKWNDAKKTLLMPFVVEFNKNPLGINKPLLYVEPISIDFGEVDTSKSFNIYNNGDVTLSWKIEGTLPQWVKSVSPMSGDLSPNKSISVSININRQGLSVGSYTTTIPVSSNGGNASVSITMKVPSAPVLSLVPTSLNFGTTPTMSSVLVSNAGGGTLNWTASKTQPWLLIMQTSGSLAGGKSQSVNITVNRAGLKPGSYSDTISFTSNGGNANVSVSMTVPEPDPQLLYTPSSMNFGTDKNQLELKITNSGGKTLNWQMTKQQNWLSLSPTNGSLTGGASQNVIVTVNRADQPPGSYQGKISITSNGGNGSVDVTMTVIELIPALAFAPTSLSFETVDSQKVFSISNNGNGKLNWSLATQSNWMFFSQTAGTLNPSSSINITVTINKAIIKPGEWTDDISINSNGGNGVIKASLKVPGLSYSPKSINFGVSMTKSIIEITNIGAGTLNWQASKKQSWITINPSEGSLETGMLVGLIITISRDGLKPGDYSDTITITTNAGNATIPITMSVPEPPAVLSFDPSSLDFGTSDTEKTFTITNKGLGTLTWQISRQQPWVTLSPLVGVLEANKSITIMVKISRANLSPGSYKDIISISSNSGGASIPITMIIPEPILPQAKLSVSSLKGRPNSQINVQLILTNGSGIAGGNITVKYNSNILEVGQIKGTEMASGMSIFANANVLGQIQIAMASTTAISFGSGALINISFIISSKAIPETETIIELVETELYNELGIPVPTKLENGTIKIEPVCIKGDVNGDGEIKSNDALLILRISAGLLEPNEHQKCSADVNDDGQIKANDAMLVLRKVAGLEAPTKEQNTAKYVVISLPRTYGVKGQLINIPIITDNFDILSCGDISIVYDSRILNLKGIKFPSNILTAGNTNKSGIIKISFACIDKLSSNNLGEIEFEVLADDTSSIAFERAELYSFGAIPIKSKLINGQFISYNVKPKQNILLQNYPNPFNPETWIPYQLSEASEVIIKIYDVSGKMVRELRLGYKPAGIYTSQDRSAYWDGKNDFGELVSSGVYFYTMQAGKYVSTKKMIVAK